MDGLTPTKSSAPAPAKVFVEVDRWENEGGSPAAAVADAPTVLVLEPLGDAFDIRARQSIQLIVPPRMRRPYAFASERDALGGISFEITSPRVA